MAGTEEVGGPLFIGSGGPASEIIPEHDSTVDVNQIVGHAVLAGPITINATVTIEGVVVVL
jgi:hypothetical protein|tara:strand:+ start:523 stop:705 length:183 start_codon:yes stop_codon:yes gene_type:complete